MSEREIMRLHLTEDLGIPAEEAERILMDDDLWIVHPSERFGIPADEEVEVWAEAVLKLEAMVDAALYSDLYGNVAVIQCLADTLSRAEIKLEREGTR